MKPSANSADKDCELFLTAELKATICAALPRSSNGKTTDSDSDAVAPKSAIFRNLDGICSPHKTADFFASANFWGRQGNHPYGENNMTLADRIEAEGRPIESLSKLERAWLRRLYCGWCEIGLLSRSCGDGLIMGEPCSMDEQRAKALIHYRPRKALAAAAIRAREGV